MAIEIVTRATVAVIEKFVDVFEKGVATKLSVDCDSPKCSLLKVR